MKHFFLPLALLLFTTILLAGEKPQILIINEDNDHYFKQTADLMTLDALQAYIDRMKDSHVTHFFMCPQGQRTSYDSKVHERIWDGMADGSPVDYGPGSGQEGRRWTSNCKKLYEMGIDPYTVWIERCRLDGISPWITMRMNDVHCVNLPHYFRNFNFWREHPELWRVPNGKTGNWTDCAFNYAQKGAYDFYMACAVELLERYDVDGFEMDWMRFCLHLTPGKEVEEAHVLTRFVRDVKAKALEMEKVRGHKILISVRVPATPQASAALGMDAVAWAKEGLIDQIVASCFFSTADFNISANDWKKAVGIPGFPIFTATDEGVTCGNGVSRTSFTREIYDGWANNMYANGSDGLYLFNLVYHPDLFEELIKRGFAQDEIVNLPRRHVVSFRDYMATYGKPELNQEIQLPKSLGEPAEVKVQFGRKPTVSGAFYVTAGFFEGEGLNDVEFQVQLNGSDALEAADLPRPERFGSMKRVIRFRVPAETVCDGLNAVKVTQKSGKTQKLGWVEMEFQPN